MNRLNRKMEYALMSLKIMASKSAHELTSAKEIAERAGCPFDATARVLQLMAQKEILRSEHGAYGGYVLLRDLAGLSLFELLEVVMGKMAVAKCLQHDMSCELKGRCNIISPVSSLNRKIADFYQTLSVGELLGVRETARMEAQL